MDTEPDMTEVWSFLVDLAMTGGMFALLRFLLGEKGKEEVKNPFKRETAEPKAPEPQTMNITVSGHPAMMPPIPVKVTHEVKHLPYPRPVEIIVIITGPDGRDNRYPAYVRGGAHFNVANIPIPAQGVYSIALDVIYGD